MRVLLALSVVAVGLWSVACVECEHLTDCPGDLVCSADGTCVERAPLDYSSENPVFPNDPNNTLPPPDEGVPPEEPPAPPPVETNPPPSPSVGTGVIDGNIGGSMYNQSQATASVDLSWQIMLSSDDGALVMLNGAYASSLSTMLATPGRHQFSSSTMDGELYGVACDWDYDAPTDGEVIISEPNDQGEVQVDIQMTNFETSVRASTVIIP